MIKDTKKSIQRFIGGHRAAERRQQELRRAEGPQPEQAIAEALAAAAALAEMGQWPGPRDPASEAAVIELRRRWVRIQTKAKRAQGR